MYHRIVSTNTMKRQTYRGAPGTAYAPLSTGAGQQPQQHTDLPYDEFLEDLEFYTKWDSVTSEDSSSFYYGPGGVHGGGVSGASSGLGLGLASDTSLENPATDDSAQGKPGTIKTTLRNIFGYVRCFLFSSRRYIIAACPYPYGRNFIRSSLLLV